MVMFAGTISEAISFTTDSPPDAVNLLVAPTDFSDAAWVKNGTITVDVAEQPDTGLKTADNVEDTSAAVVQAVEQTIVIPADAQVYTFIWWVKKAPAYITTVQLSYALLGGTTIVVSHGFNPATGAIVLFGGHPAPDSLSVVDNGEFYIVTMTDANNGTNTSILNVMKPALNTDATPGTAEVVATLGDHTFGRTEIFASSNPIPTPFVFAVQNGVATISEALALYERQLRGAKIPAGVEFDFDNDGLDNEHVESRRFKQDANGKTLERIFTIKGTDDPVDAQDIGPQLGQAFDEAGNFVVANREFMVLAINGKGGEKGALRLTVGYGEASLTPSGLPGRAITFEGAAESRHITRAFTQENFPAAKDNVGVLIGPINKDKEFEGVDIEEPVLAQNEVHYRSSFTTDERRTIVGLLQKLNDGTFRGFPEGEVRFTRFSASLQSNGQWMLNFGFAINPGRQFVVDISSDAKPPVVSQAQVTQEGWQYYWDETADILDNGERKTVNKAVHLADVYQKADYEDLGIGTGPIE